MANNTPVEGMGVTLGVGSDRYPWTVSAVLGLKRIVVQRDQYRRTDKNGMSESQTYEFTRDPDGSTRTLTLRKNGRWVEVGESMNGGGSWGVGHRDAYQDPHF